MLSVNRENPTEINELGLLHLSFRREVDLVHIVYFPVETMNMKTGDIVENS